MLTGFERISSADTSLCIYTLTRVSSPSAAKFRMTMGSCVLFAIVSSRKQSTEANSGASCCRLLPVMPKLAIGGVMREGATN